MPLPSRDDPRRPLNGAVLLIGLIGILQLLAGIVVLSVAIGRFGASQGEISMVEIAAVAFLTLILGMLFIVLASALKSHKEWAPTAAIVLASLEGVLGLLGVFSTIHLDATLLTIMVFVVATMALLIFFLAASYPAMQMLDTTAGRGFAPALPGAPSISSTAHHSQESANHSNGKALLYVRDLRTYFPIKRGIFSTTVGHVKAVDGVSFEIQPGKTLGLVGESGCGKTTVGRTILRLIPKTSGEVLYKGENFFAYQGEELRKLRRHMQIVFQDPVSSLNPRMTVGNIIGEPIEVHGIAQGQAKRDMVAGLLHRVGLDPTYASRYPHEFSGGQRQRIGIARALALSPDFIVCDEPVSALDVSIQSQILNLLDDLQRERNIAYLFIAHNLAVVEHFSDDVAVMYLGQIVEKSPARELYANPKHPYTVALLSAVPEPNPRPTKQRIVLKGEVPSPSNPPTGCPFHPRCPLARQLAREAGASETTTIQSVGETVRVLRKCVEARPPLESKTGEPGHIAACWFTK